MTTKLPTPCHFRLAFVGLVLLAAIANLGFAQDGPLPTEKIIIGVAVWLIAAILAFVVWSLLKVIAKIGVVLFPIVAGVMAATQVPDRASTEAIVSICVPWVILGAVAGLNCYLYASVYNVERDLRQLKRETTVCSELKSTTP